jgi:hypothetical protein
MHLTRRGEVETFGDGDDLHVHLIAHVNMPADDSGMPSANKLESRTECR